MKKIKQIVLKNFQIHKKLVINPSEFFNVIKGPNDYGKSSIIRALYWLFTNSPSGDWMRREVGDKMYTVSVKVVYEDGDVVKRTKGDNINEYRANGEDYKNFGFSVPEPVQKIIGTERIKLGSIQLFPNIAMQEDKPFLVYETGSVKASVINMLTGTDIIERAVKDFNKDKLSNARTIKSSENDIKGLTSDIKNLKYLREIGKKLEKIREKRQKLEEKSKTHDELVILQSDLQRHKDALKIKIPDLSRIRKIDKKIDKKYSRIRELTKMKSIRKSQRGMVKFINKQIKGVKKKLEALGNICPECGRAM